MFLCILQHMDLDPRHKILGHSQFYVCFSLRLHMMVKPSKTIQFGSYDTFGHDA